jgi:uncharacterized RDD family membrane protein YckC
MTCAFCGSRNGDGEHRCRRCGRRPDDTLTGEYTLQPTIGPLAVKLQPAPAATAEAPRQSNFERAVQVPLFLLQERPAPNVIPFESYAPETRATPGRLRQKAPSAARTGRRSARVVEGQGSLDFLPSAPPKARTLPTTVEAQIYCDSPVAARVHRLLAAALDWSLVLIAYGMFLAAFHQFGGELVWNKATIVTFTGMLALFGVTYGLMWSWAGRETAGMQWTGLHLLTFDGFPPDRRQRFLRFIGSCLSLGTVLGLAWSLVDEECLGWQDYISHTFPTPLALDEQVLRRR